MDNATPTSKTEVGLRFYLSDVASKELASRTNSVTLEVDYLPTGVALAAKVIRLNGQLVPAKDDDDANLSFAATKDGFGNTMWHAVSRLRSGNYWITQTLSDDRHWFWTNQSAAWLRMKVEKFESHKAAIDACEANERVVVREMKVAAAQAMGESLHAFFKEEFSGFTVAGTWSQLTPAHRSKFTAIATRLLAAAKK